MKTILYSFILAFFVLATACNNGSSEQNGNALDEK